jgi:hypothetical protein
MYPASRNTFSPGGFKKLENFFLRPHFAVDEDVLVDDSVVRDDRGDVFADAAEVSDTRRIASIADDL